MKRDKKRVLEICDRLEALGVPQSAVEPVRDYVADWPEVVKEFAYNFDYDWAYPGDNSPEGEIILNPQGDKDPKQILIDHDGLIQGESSGEFDTFVAEEVNGIRCRDLEEELGLDHGDVVNGHTDLCPSVHWATGLCIMLLQKDPSVPTFKLTGNMEC